jgi:predicted TIM-barrel fold metal-dependent hydrolase
MEHLIIDSDSHIMEPTDLWKSYVPRSQKAIALSIEEVHEPVDDLVARRPYICFEGSKLFPVCGSTPLGIHALEITGAAAADGGQDYDHCRARLLAIQDALFGYSGQTPLAGVSASHRLSWMQQHRISHSLIFPTWGSMWERYLHDRPDAIAANMAAYNRWILDFCAADRARLIPVCQVSPNALEWSLGELRFLARHGAKCILLRPVLYGGVPLSHPKWNALWQEITDLDLAVFFHVSGMGRGGADFFEEGWYAGEQRGQHNGIVWGSTVHVPLMLTLTTMIRDGLFARFPNLRLASAEHGFRWVGPWLEEFDERQVVSVSRGFLSSEDRRVRPSELIRKHMWFAGVHAQRYHLLDRVMFSSDFPHPECATDPVEEFASDTAHLERDETTAILARNCQDLLGCSVAA